MNTPTERYTAAKERSQETETGLPEFRASLGFDLDPFQEEACRAVATGSGVLVAAPTGAGKTVVGEFAIFQALRTGRKAFYTTPIKALSNQKYSDLVDTYGAERVGLLTGDMTINGEAEIVVMTTEVLRNMLYADSDTLDSLGFVVMDEVHYLADKFRGAVWEEVIIHLRDDVQVISLSATVSNAEEFGGWLDAVRGDTRIIVSEHRPIPLYQHVMVGGRLLNLFAEDLSFDQAPNAPESVATVNPELTKLAHRTMASNRPHGQRGRRPGSGSWGDKREQLSTRVSRPEIIMALDHAGLLPALVFIFSRKGCDAAVAQCVRSGLAVTTIAEATEIEQAIDLVAHKLPPDDLEVLGFWPWREGLMRGFAAHHAGLLPIFKEIVEDLFIRGLVKVVFATETLALGVNMPARSVVMEKLEKFNGESHVAITAGEYTQLTGRAGRRGIDVEGHAVVLWQQDTDPAAVAGLASKRTYPLNSSFRPTYNMSLNLTSQFGRERARGILETSFAQFQADRSVVGMAKQVRSREESLAGYAKSMTCHLGDFTEYARLRAELSNAEKDAAKTVSRLRRSAAAESLETLMRGDVIEVTGTRRLGRCVVIELDSAWHDPRPTVLTEDKHIRRIGVQDLNGPVEVVSQIRVPKGFTGRSPKERKDLAASLRNALAESRPPRRGAPGFDFTGSAEEEARITELRTALKAHPCHGCPEREDHARWGERYTRLLRDTSKLRSQISGRTNTISKTFDKVATVLEDFEYLVPASADADQGQITVAGQRLRRIYGERDLLTSLVMETGAMNTMTAEELAGFISALVFHARREENGPDPRMPTAKVQLAWETSVNLWSQLSDAEASAGLPETAAPDSGLIWPMYKWARGSDLRECLRGTDLAAGDFVRWAKQVIDVLDQLAKIPDLDAGLVRSCNRAVQRVRRGVVSYSNVVD
ncbi:DEAD/DEAH box helicase [Paeniglutamicibacter gangotriensis]|uniref:Dead/deah box helicase domain protein n=1 Tax=Paeniglutamicibacter gangotriensis Lz1y TaxID=1276920 RepID=M7MNU7_9MICC|nr:DEAD/DEAH box helicase [Paeniglutamicibacter gangotriensis]EMQ96625.1 dead/deah box helicase domain protein [Paeniglutamicibacter gangotriensis Lz1y]